MLYDLHMDGGVFHTEQKELLEKQQGDNVITYTLKDTDFSITLPDAILYHWTVDYNRLSTATSASGLRNMVICIPHNYTIRHIVENGLEIGQWVDNEWAPYAHMPEIAPNVSYAFDYINHCIKLIVNEDEVSTASSYEPRIDIVRVSSVTYDLEVYKDAMLVNVEDVSHSSDARLASYPQYGTVIVNTAQAGTLTEIWWNADTTGANAGYIFKVEVYDREASAWVQVGGNYPSCPITGLDYSISGDCLRFRLEANTVLSGAYTTTPKLNYVYIYMSLEPSYSADADLRKTQNITSNSDIILLKTENLSIGADSYVSFVNNPTYSANAKLYTINNKTYSSDINLQKTQNDSYSAFCCIRETFNTTYSAFCYLQKAANTSTEADILLQFNKDGWQYDRYLTVNASLVPETTANHVTLVHLEASGDNDDNGDLATTLFACIGSTVAEAKYKMCFTDPTGVEKYDFEIGYITSTEIECWVRIPSFTSTTRLRLWYREDASSVIETDPDGTWQFDDAIWHLHETGIGIGQSSLYKDSTLNDYDGDNYSSATGKTGQIALGQQFDGVDDYIRLPKTTSALMTNDFSFSAWINITSAGTLISNNNGQTGRFDIGIDANGYLYAAINDTAVVTGTTDLIDAGYTHVSITRSGNTWTTYINGALESTDTDSGTVVGERYVIGKKYSGGSYITGYIDEVEIKPTAKSAERIELEYNQAIDNDTFWSLSAEGQVVYEADVWLQDEYNKKFYSDTDLQDTFNNSYNAFCYLQESFDAEFGANTLLYETKIKSWNANTLLQKTENDSYNANIILYKTFDSAHSADIAIYKTINAAFNADIILQKQNLNSLYAATVVLYSTSDCSYNSDVEIQEEMESSHKADVILQTTVDSLYYSDISISITRLNAYSATIILYETKNVNYSAIVYLQDEFEENYSANVHLQDEFNTSYSATVIMRTTEYSSHGADILIYKTFNVSHSSDIWLQEQNQSVSYSSIAYLQDEFGVSFVCDIKIGNSYDDDIPQSDGRSKENLPRSEGRSKDEVLS